MSKETIQTGIRMVGHLLEHHSCTHSAARNSCNEPTSPTGPEARTWCATGACQVVADRLGISFTTLDEISDQLAQELGYTANFKLWDGGSEDHRQAFVKAHQEYVYPSPNGQ